MALTTVVSWLASGLLGSLVGVFGAVIVADTAAKRQAGQWRLDCRRLEWRQIADAAAEVQLVLSRYSVEDWDKDEPVSDPDIRHLNAATEALGRVLHNRFFIPAGELTELREKAVDLRTMVEMNLLDAGAHPVGVGSAGATCVQIEEEVLRRARVSLGIPICGRAAAPAPGAASVSS